MYHSGYNSIDIPKKKKIIREQVKETLHYQSIRVKPCCSSYSSPIVIVKKKRWKNRFCIDFRKLNQITEDTTQPILIIHEELKKLGKARIFTNVSKLIYCVICSPVRSIDSKLLLLELSQCQLMKRNVSNKKGNFITFLLGEKYV